MIFHTGLSVYTEGPYFAKEGEKIAMDCKITAALDTKSGNTVTIGWKHKLPREDETVAIAIMGKKTTEDTFLNDTLFRYYKTASFDDQGEYYCYLKISLWITKSNVTWIGIQGWCTLTQVVQGVANPPNPTFTSGLIYATVCMWHHLVLLTVLTQISPY